MSVGGQLPGLELAANIRCRLGSPRKWTVRCSTCSKGNQKKQYGPAIRPMLQA